MSDIGSIYLIACEYPFSVKIGYTRRDPQARLQQLQTGSPNKLCLLGWFPGDIKDEKELHTKFAEHRLAGEWFHICLDNQDEFADIFNVIRVNNLLVGYDPSGAK